MFKFKISINFGALASMIKSSVALWFCMLLLLPVTTWAQSLTITVSDITIEATAPETPVTVANLGAMTASGATLTFTPESPFVLGDHTITWMAVDADDNTATATQILTISDTLPPELIIDDAGLANSIVEATAALTPVTLSTATSTDIVDGSLAIIVTLDGDSSQVFSPGDTIMLPPGPHSFTWTSTDLSDNEANDYVSLVVEDKDAPIITFVAPSSGNELEINADSRFVYIDNVMEGLGINIVEILIDSVSINFDGEIIEDAEETKAGQAFLSGGLHLESGTHILGLSVTDHADQVGTNTLTINVVPRVDFASDQVVGVGTQLTVKAVLSGPAASYPVTIPFAIDSIASLTATATTTGTITISSGEYGSVNFMVADGLTADASLTFSVDGAVTNANPTGGTPAHKVTIRAEDVAPSVNPRLIQNTSTVAAVTAMGGEITIASNAMDLNGGTLTFDWSGSDAALIAVVALSTDSTSHSLKLTPSSLDEGMYYWQVQVSDTSNMMTTVRGPLLVVGDSPTMVVADVDGDGIPNDKDTASFPLEVLPKYTQLGETSALVVSEGGIELGLGSMALSETFDGDSIGGAAIPLAQLGDDLAANLGNLDFEAVEMIDFRAGNLPEAGASARIVFPLSTPTSNSRLRRYDSTQDQWQDFSVDSNNKIYVAVNQDLKGSCPVVNDSQYTEVTSMTTLSDGTQIPMLPDGNYCAQLLIQDAGPNDADGLANAIIMDTFAFHSAIVSQLSVTDTTTIDDGTVELGDTGIEMLRFSLDASSSNLVLEDLTLTAGGDESSSTSSAGNEDLYVANVNLYKVSSADAAISGSPVGTGRFSGDNGTLVISFPSDYSLDMGESHFVVTYDFSTIEQLNEFKN